jgi:hypothetical protein
MSYQARLDKAKEIVDTHNLVVGAELAVDFAKFENQLKINGGTSEEALKGCKYEQLQRFGLPELLAQQVANVFRASAEAETAKPKVVVSGKQVKHATVRQLVEWLAENPDDQSTGYFKRLKEIVGDRACVVFHGGQIVVDKTTEFVNLIKQGYPKLPTTVDVGGSEVAAVYQLGKLPTVAVEEDPLRPGQPLLPNGLSADSSLDWGSAPKRFRQFVYLGVVESREIDGSDPVLETKLFELSKSPDGFKELQRMFTRTNELFAHRSSLGNLPLLLISRGGVGVASSNKAFSNNAGKNRTY